jgi:sulfite reductase alpha subunit-like flavoprotein
MVGPGTGLAPFRSFILHRLLAAGLLGPDGKPAAVQPDGAAAVGEMVLYFGCRKPDQDYLYGSDLEAWAAAGLITLHTAFSRAQVRTACVLCGKRGGDIPAMRF